jgi:nitrile hydratase
VTPRFAVGDAVRTRAQSADGHTRLPRYLAQRRGRIEAVHGPFPLADDRARGDRCPRSETLYTVVFDGVDVWGERAAERLRISADLWDSYLDREG